MRRLPWDVLLALLAGLGAGLVYSWMISPLRVTNADPTTLRPDFKEDYRSAIAAAYAATGNLARAESRLALLKDPDPVQALNAQAQRMLADSESFAQADEVAALALAIQSGAEAHPPSNFPTETLQEVEASFTETPPPPLEDIPFVFTETPPSVATDVQAILASATPRPTQTLPPTLGAPYKLTGQDSICDTNLPDGLLQVIVVNSNRRQMAGIGINITWDGGEEQFFTGLKPELGNGYADYMMAPNISYTVQLAIGSDVATGLITPTCQAPSGGSFFGGIKLTFQQP